MEDKRLKIAMQLTGSNEGWMGGKVHSENFFISLQEKSYDAFLLYLLVEGETKHYQKKIDGMEVKKIINYHIPERWTYLWFVGRIFDRLLRRNFLIERSFKKKGVNVFFDHLINSRYPSLATLSWLPDFQHKRLPSMFKEEECFLRDKLFLRTSQFSTRVILATQSIQRDFKLFIPQYAYKTRVLRPVSRIPESVYIENISSILKLYNLPEKFFYLPNQFWKHKNHELVFRAIKILRDRNVKVFLVCTGAAVDYRNPDYFDSLWKKRSEWGIQNQIVYLKLIPYQHVLLLMRQSLCVLNPSLFEGFGFTVDEACSLGKRVLLSDIPVHHEHLLSKTIFFNCHDENELAEKMKQIWCDVIPGPDLELESEARLNLPKRKDAFAKDFLSVAQEALNEVKNFGSKRE